MGRPPVSVIVVSRHRPAALSLCLQALTLQDHPAFQLVLVADPESVNLRPDLPIRRVSFDEPNISAARNAGIAAASGEIVAFIDDDAVAEPTWLTRLTEPFTDPAVLAATGVTRGRDGLGWQVRAERMTRDGLARTIPPGQDMQLLRPEQGEPVSTLGTNCAFRRPTLLELGGFDPAFAYHLDESDLNMRMAARWPEALTAIVPGAEVVHGWAGDLRRTGAGVPTDLRAIGRSTAIFCARYGGDPARAAERQRRRLLRLMVAGRLDPSQLNPLLRGFHAGARETAARPPAPAGMAGTAPEATHLPGTGPRPARLIAGWHRQAGRLRAQATRAAGEGQIVTLLLLTPTMLPHRARFVSAGYWEQLGGLWGPSEPGDSSVAFWRLPARITRESARIGRTRGWPD